MERTLAIAHFTQAHKMDDEQKLEKFIGEYKEVCSTVSNQMREDMVAIPAVIIDLARDYIQHGDINIFFMEVHAAIFALAHENQEDFSHIARWWMVRYEEFIDLINTT